MKCYWKAHCVGDIEGGIALSKLAKLYEKTNEADQAAAAYTQVKFYFISLHQKTCKIFIRSNAQFFSLFNDIMENYYTSSLWSTVNP